MTEPPVDPPPDFDFDNAQTILPLDIWVASGRLSGLVGDATEAPMIQLAMRDMDGNDLVVYLQTESARYLLEQLPWLLITAETGPLGEG